MYNVILNTLGLILIFQILVIIQACGKIMRAIRIRSILTCTNSDMRKFDKLKNYSIGYKKNYIIIRIVYDLTINTYEYKKDRNAIGATH